MPQELEIEFKNLLLEEEYKKLISHYELTEDDFFTQENIYFDTPTLTLKEHRSALRIRIKNQSAEITLKTPQGNHLLETNVTITIEDARKMIHSKKIDLPKEVQEQLGAINLSTDEPFVLVTHLKTKRAEKEVSEGLLVFDQSWYADTTDYELEVEVAEEKAGEAWFNQLLSEFSIPKRETKNKIQRAFNALNKA